MSEEDVRSFAFRGYVMAYRRLGTGPKALLAFHGFGQTHEVFIPLESALGNQFTIFAIDLFFHGDSRYSGEQPLTKADWRDLLTAFLPVHTITRFSLMGFSLGGRFALTTAEVFADRLDHLFLIAPDGVTQNNWYRLATATAPGRNLFGYILQHLPLLSWVGNGLVRAGLLNPTLIRFAEHSLGTPQQRQLAYQSWTQFRAIQPNLAAVASLMNHYLVRVRVFTGAFDRIVPATYVLPLTQRLHHYTLTNLEASHNHLIEQAGPILANAE